LDGLRKIRKQMKVSAESCTQEPTRLVAIHNKNCELLERLSIQVENFEQKVSVLIGVAPTSDEKISDPNDGALGQIESQQDRMGFLLNRLEEVNRRFNGII